MTVALHTPLGCVRARARRLDGSPHDYDALVEMARTRAFVLLGECTHGTREFYVMRAQITRRLIEEAGFDAVAIEGDWPDAARVHRFIGGGPGTAEASLGGFERFPRWMWRNEEVLRFVSDLRSDNDDRGGAPRVGFYGLDLYSLYRSADAVVRYLDRVDPEQAQVARDCCEALDHVRDPQQYGYECARSMRPSARDAAQRVLMQLRANADEYRAPDGLPAEEAQYFAERNASVVLHAERYYRAMFDARVNTWNLRDAHMFDTLMSLAAHRRACGGTGRIVVWAHNSHLGDARATEMGRRGEWNLGQLVRAAVPDDTLLVGFTTYTGHVAAASHWDGDVERKFVRPALPDSVEHLFHATRLDRFFLDLRDPETAPLRASMLERAIGVLYLPQSERQSHYFEASLGAQFDAVFHLDETDAVEPLGSPRPAPAREAVDVHQ
jgi:erythromycin esterase-like protein